MMQPQEYYLVVTLKQPDDEADILTTEGDPMAVSYTHLTLPTKRIV